MTDEIIFIIGALGVTGWIVACMYWRLYAAANEYADALSDLLNRSIDSLDEREN